MCGILSCMSLSGGVAEGTEGKKLNKTKQQQKEEKLIQLNHMSATYVSNHVESWK